MLLPLQGQLDRSSGPSSQGFNINIVEYSPKVRQVAYAGPDKESSREEQWKVVWKLLIRRTPQEVIDTGEASTYDTIKKFYEDQYLTTVEWNPVEIGVDRIWEIIPNSFKQNNPAGCIFEVSFKLKFLYNK